MKEKRIQLPLTKEVIKELNVGDKVLLSGTMYTARDAAHKKIIEALKNNEELPFSLQKATIYYVGPSPAKDGFEIGAAGPTTSYRMDPYTPALLEEGLLGMIGKGQRSDEVIASIKKNGAVYFAAVGGAAALLSKKIENVEVIAYPELGPEAIHRFKIRDFPCYVAVDSNGNQIFNNKKD